MTWPGTSHGSLPLFSGSEADMAVSANGTEWPTVPGGSPAPGPGSHSSVLWIIIVRCGTSASVSSRPPCTTIAPDSPAKICAATCSCRCGWYQNEPGSWSSGSL